MYWSRFPGKFVNKNTGEVMDAIVKDLKAKGKLKEGEQHGPRFTGTVREWYETLIEAMVDCVNKLQELTFSKNGRAIRHEVKVYASPDLCCVLQATVLFSPVDPIEGQLDIASRQIGVLKCGGGFVVYEDSLQTNDYVKIVATFDIEEGAPQVTFGRIMILDMPENGRKA
jgi:hypothetical protein